MAVGTRGRLRFNAPTRVVFSEAAKSSAPSLALMGFPRGLARASALFPLVSCHRWTIKKSIKEETFQKGKMSIINITQYHWLQTRKYEKYHRLSQVVSQVTESAGLFWAKMEDSYEPRRKEARIMER